MEAMAERDEVGEARGINLKRRTRSGLPGRRPKRELKAGPDGIAKHPEGGTSRGVRMRSR